MNLVERRIPDEDLIHQLEKLLAQAKSGELIGYMAVLNWHGGGVSHMWCVNPRCYQRSMLGEMMVCMVSRANEMDAQ